MNHYRSHIYARTLKHNAYMAQNMFMCGYCLGHFKCCQQKLQSFLIIFDSKQLHTSTSMNLITNLNSSFYSKNVNILEMIASYINLWSETKRKTRKKISLNMFPSLTFLASVQWQAYRLHSINGIYKLCVVYAVNTLRFHSKRRGKRTEKQQRQHHLNSV